MEKCSKCQQEFTKGDEKKGNFRQGLMGEMMHRRCPGTVLTCHVCGQPVADEENVGTTQFPRHQGCYLNHKPSTKKANPSLWIVKR